LLDAVTKPICHERVRAIDLDLGPLAYPGLLYFVEEVKRYKRT
jgi:hypothetical protein